MNNSIARLVMFNLAKKGMGADVGADAWYRLLSIEGAIEKVLPLADLAASLDDGEDNLWVNIVDHMGYVLLCGTDGNGRSHIIHSINL